MSMTVAEKLIKLFNDQPGSFYFGSKVLGELVDANPTTVRSLLSTHKDLKPYRAKRPKRTTPTWHETRPCSFQKEQLLTQQQFKESYIDHYSHTVLPSEIGDITVVFSKPDELIQSVLLDGLYQRHINNVLKFPTKKMLTQRQDETAFYSIQNKHYLFDRRKYFETYRRKANI